MLDSEFKILRPDLEECLEDLIGEVSYDEKTLYLEVNGTLDELCDLGYLKMDSKPDFSLSAFYTVTKKGLHYFGDKKQYFDDLKLEALSKLEISSYDEWVLATLTQLSFQSETGLISDGFDTDDMDQVASIKKLSNQGYLNVTYADNAPYFISITRKGLDYFAGPDEDPQPQSKLAEKIASVIGAFGGSFTRELNDL